MYEKGVHWDMLELIFHKLHKQQDIHVRMFLLRFYINQVNFNIHTEFHLSLTLIQYCSNISTPLTQYHKIKIMLRNSYLAQGTQIFLYHFLFDRILFIECFMYLKTWVKMKAYCDVRHKNVVRNTSCQK